MHGRVARWFGLLCFTSLGCVPDDVPTPTQPAKDNNQRPLLDPSRTSVVRGFVRWQGDLPAEKSPHRPVVDLATKGVRDAIVMLQGVGPMPAHRGPLLVEIRDKRIHIVQDGHTSSVGIVQVGDEIEVVNHDVDPHALRARGAALFSIPLPEKDRVAKRRLTQAGVVTLSNAAHHPAMSAHLIVAENSCATRTNAQGEFTLTNVPPGAHTLACWMPSGNVGRRERDPGSALVVRLHFAAPVERTAPIRVEPGQTTSTTFAWSLADFAKQ